LLVPPEFTHRRQASFGGVLRMAYREAEFFAGVQDYLLDNGKRLRIIAF
jgi:hypothetical protein